MRFCQQLKDQNELDANFRPASVETQWLTTKNKEGKSGDTFGIRVSTADYKLRGYLTQCAEEGETITIPALTRYQSPHSTPFSQ